MNFNRKDHEVFSQMSQSNYIHIGLVYIRDGFYSSPMVPALPDSVRLTVADK